MLNTLGAAPRRTLRGRRGKTLTEAGPAPVPTSRATVIRPEPFEDATVANRWLSDLRGDQELASGEIDAPALKAAMA